MKKNPFAYFIHFILLFLVNQGCGDVNIEENKINSINIEISLERFDQKFDSLSESNIFDLKNKYSFLFPENYSNSFWLKKSSDTIYDILKTSVNERFNEIIEVEEEISHLYKHLKNEFPKIRVPRIISVINNVDYQNKVILADSLLIISIDSYLGFDNYLYKGIPLYIRKNLDAKYLTSDITEKYANELIENPLNRNFLSKIIFYGKKIYFKDIILPHENDQIKIGYTNDEYKWANENELFIWQYIIEKQLLYSNNETLEARFLYPAPFSKFYLEIDNDSPGRIGQWVGWQIVKSYAKRYPEIGLEEILKLSAEELFIKSKYKPRKSWR